MDTVVPVPVICNPSTGQYASLPNESMKKGWKSFLGFDPIDKQFKVLSMRVPLYEGNESPQVLILGTGNVSWRKIHCPLNHFSPYRDEGACINGVMYNLAIRIDVPRSLVIGCFDVRSEKFKFIDRDFSRQRRRTKLINYFEYGAAGQTIMYLIKDVKKPERWQHVCTSWEYNFVNCNVSVTATGEVVWTMDNPSKPFYVFYFNPRRNTSQRVEIQGFGANHDAFDNRRKVKVFADHVEDLNFII